MFCFVITNWEPLLSLVPKPKRNSSGTQAVLGQEEKQGPSPSCKTNGEMPVRKTGFPSCKTNGGCLDLFLNENRKVTSKKIFREIHFTRLKRVGNRNRKREMRSNGRTPSPRMSHGQRTRQSQHLRTLRATRAPDPSFTHSRLCITADTASPLPRPSRKTSAWTLSHALGRPSGQHGTRTCDLIYSRRRMFHTQRPNSRPVTMHLRPVRGRAASRANPSSPAHRRAAHSPCGRQQATAAELTAKHPGCDSLQQEKAHVGTGREEGTQLSLMHRCPPCPGCPRPPPCGPGHLLSLWKGRRKLWMLLTHQPTGRREGKSGCTEHPSCLVEAGRPQLLLPQS